MPFLVKLAWQDLRSSGRSLWIFCACLALGVSLVFATGGLYRLINQSLLSDTRLLMGGDLEVESDAPLPESALSWMSNNADFSLVTEVDTMLGTSKGRFVRVELQAVDSMYPLYGRLSLQPEVQLNEATGLKNGIWGVVIDPLLADRLSVGVGDPVLIGSLEMQVRALVIHQPDRNLNADWGGTPVLLHADALHESGLIQPGSRVDYEYNIRTDSEPLVWQSSFYDAFPDQGWRVRTFSDRSRRVAERLGQIASGLLIIGFSTLFIGGLGVFNSIHAYLQGKLKTIATLRALGLRNRRLSRLYLLQIGMLGVGASVAGVLVGAVLALIGGELVATQVALSISVTDLLYPAVISIGFGVLTAFAFALPALGKALATEPAMLFRGQSVDNSDVPRQWWFATYACGLIIVGLIMLVLPDRLFAVGFVLVVVLLLLLLDLVVRVLRRWAQSLDHHPKLSGRFSLKLAIANLHRPGNALRTSLLSLGSAMTLLVACSLIVATLVRAIHATIPQESPGLVLYDVLDSQLDDVIEAAQVLPEVERLEMAPLVLARISAINGTPLSEIDEINVTDRREGSQNRYKLSYSVNNIDGARIVDGGWWSEVEEAEFPRLAFEDREAASLGLKRGDRVTFIIEDQSIDVEVAAIYSQKGLQTRFWFEGLLSKAVLDPFVHRHVGAAYIDDRSAVALQARIAQVAPNAITVRTQSMLKVARVILSKAGAGLSAVALVSLFASLLVLVSVMAAGRQRQIYDATILHSLGVRMRSIKQSLQLEYCLLATLASGFAVILGSAIALPLLHYRLKLPALDLIWIGAVVAFVVSCLTLGLATVYLLKRLRLKPATLLRDSF